jgi:hypothetical protein
VDPRSGLDDVDKRKFLTVPGLEIQPVASRYTDYVVPALMSHSTRYNYFVVVVTLKKGECLLLRMQLNIWQDDLPLTVA